MIQKEAWPGVKDVQAGIDIGSNSMLAMLGIAFGMSGLVGVGAGYTLSRMSSPTYQKPVNTQKEYLRDKLLNEVEKANMDLETQHKEQLRSVQNPSKGIMI